MAKMLGEDGSEGPRKGGPSKASGARMRHLEERGLRWWFVRAVPPVCRRAEGERRPDGKPLSSYKENLHTSDKKVAMARRDELVRETDARWADMKAGRYVPGAGPTPAQRGALWREAVAAAATKAGPSGTLHGAPAVNLNALPAEEQREWERDMAPAADDPSFLMGLVAEESERLRGKDRRAFDIAFTGAVAVDHHLEGYLAQAPLGAKAKASRRGLVSRFARWAAEDGKTLDAITRQVAGRYAGALATMHPATRKNHLGALRGYWGWLHRRGLVEGGDTRGAPWTDQEMPYHSAAMRHAAAGEKERPFTEAEVAALLNAPWPGSLDAAWEVFMRDVCRVGLLAGMRLGEVLNLTVGDVEAGEPAGGVAGSLAFEVRKSKTDAGRRRAPVHSALVAVIEARCAGKLPTALVFHECDGMRDPGDTFTKRFKRFREALEVDDKRAGQRRSLVNFHSWRRTFVTQARHAGHSEADIADVAGHDTGKKTITFGTYTPGASWAKKVEVVESVRLPPGVTGAPPRGD